MDSSLRIALLQAGYEAGAMESKYRRMAADGARAGARLLCLPAFSLTPYFGARPEGVAGASLESVPGGPSCGLFSELAREHGVFVIGSLLERGDFGGRRRRARAYATTVLFAPGGALVGGSRQVHVPDVPGAHERAHIEPMNVDFPVYGLPDAAGAAVAMATHHDAWFPEVARCYALQGAELLVCPVAVGAAALPSGGDAWAVALRSHAVANGFFVAGVNRIGSEAELTFHGSSLVAAPGGEVLAQASPDTEEVLTADLDPEAAVRWRARYPFLEQRDPNAYLRLIEGAQVRVG